MKNKTTIFLGIVLMLGIVTYKAFDKPAVEPAIGGILKPIEIAKIDYNNLQIADTINMDEVGTITKKYITTSTNDLGNTIKTGVKVDFSYRGTDTSISIDKAGWNNCRRGMWGTSTKAWCVKRAKYQINQNLKWAKQSIDAQIAEANQIDYVEELNNTGL